MAIDQHTATKPVGGHPEKADVVLISMPFSPLFHPSISLGLLKAALAPPGIATKVFHFTLPFAELISTPLYTHISEGGAFAHYDLVGEWIFAGALFDSPHSDVEGYIEDVLRGRSPAHRESYYDWEPAMIVSVQDILDVRGKVEGFLDSCLERVLGYRPAIVGFTSVFQQQVASLALAKRIKAQAPQTCIVLGGSANCEGVMGAEVIRQFPFVDAVVSGEGDLVFPELVQRVLKQEPFSDLQGVYTRDNIDLVRADNGYSNARPVRDMDTLPFPNYDDFFQQLETSRLDEDHPTQIPLQTSRGCWWGEKSHCTYCGFNGMSMTYRSKSADRALDELLYLTNKYPGSNVLVVDNILDMKYFKDFIPQLAARQLDLELYYEVKANLRKEQVRLLRDAGITSLQPGIESLSSQILTLMRKGISALQNIQLLKWCKELGIRAYWNMLWGFPGESPEEYARMAELVPLLTHLQPPNRAGAIRLDRFSPNFECASQLGFANVEPFPAYHYVYPLAPEVVANLAYYFTFSYREPRDVASYTQPVREEIITWRAVHEQSELLLLDKGAHNPLLIWDLRPIAREPLTILAGLQRTLYLECDRARTARQLQQVIDRAGETASVPGIEDLLQPLIEHGLMLREGDSYLSLAVPLGEYLPRRPILEMAKPLL